MRLVAFMAFLSLAFGTAFALDTSTKNNGQSWSACKLNCANDYPNPNLRKACEAACDANPRNVVTQGKKGTAKALDQNLPELTPDN
jgi:hypothetical protein